MLSIAAALAATFGVTALSARVVLLWVASAFAIVAVAYAMNRPQFLMKRDDGSQPFFGMLILWPYFILARISLRLYCWVNRRNVAVAEVLPGVWFARRLTANEIRSAGVTWSAVLDLAAEFPRIAVDGVVYRSLPILDGAVPPESLVREAVGWIAKQSKEGNVLVHCALGHGRTGTVVVAWLLLYGHVPDVDTGVVHLRKRRSSFGMSAAQMKMVERLTPEGAR